MKTKYLGVSYYPHNDKQLNCVIATLNDFILYLNGEFNINLKFRAYSTIDFNSSLHSLLQDFLFFSEQHFNYVDINCLIDLFEIIKHPSNEMLDVIQLSHKNDIELCQFFQKAKLAASSFKIDEVFHFISLKSLQLKEGQGPWGATIGVYPFSVAIDAKGYKEIIYHEFLHQLKVSEGYNEITHLNSCDNSCWMQYEATKGNSLCEKHKNELVKFVNTMQAN
ncbi:MAG: hypothetical protein IIC75_08680 [Bacteroidetes bacterium]|nr:hypothetical protein [Bacteroidota bacterium]